MTLRVVFGLPLRQTEGFLDSLLSLMSRDLKAPDHTTLSRRNQIVVVPPLTRAHDGPIDLIVDSTGLKILGRGEWNAHKHKTSKKRRDWRKLHIGVDAEGFIVAAELTASSRDDASTLPDLLAQLEVPIRRFTADGAYDHRSIYDRASAAGTENVVIVILPCRSALSAGPTDGPWAQREASLQRIRKVGRREWQKESGYRQQARVENSFFRYKSVFGGDLKARHSKAQRREVEFPRFRGHLILWENGGHDAKNKTSLSTRVSPADSRASSSRGAAPVSWPESLNPTNRRSTTGSPRQTWMKAVVETA